jgi:hypothetical protein
MIIMKKIINFFFSAFVFFEVISLEKLFASTEKEEPVLIFDERKWRLAGVKPYADNISVFHEYVLEGEALESWSELVTIQFYPTTENFTLFALEENMKNSIRATHPLVKWASVEQSKHERMYSFSVDEVSLKESAIVRAVLTTKGVHVFQYAIKDNLSEKNKEKWMKILKNIKIKFFDQEQPKHN